MKDFSCELYTPSMGCTQRYSEIRIKDLKNITKYIENQDNTGLCEYFTSLLTELGADIHANELDRIDKFCILLGLRIISIGPTLEMKFTCESTQKEFNYKLDLFDILQKIADVEDLYRNNTVVLDENITIELGFPAKFTYENMDDIVFECLSKVTIKNRTFNIKSLSEIERENILSLLPGSISKDIVDFIIKKQKLLNDVVFLDVKSPFTADTDIIVAHFDGINDSIMEFIKTLYRVDIADMYNIIYILTSKLRFDAEYVENNLTFAEAVIYLNKYKQELADKEKAYKDQSQMGNSASAGQPMPMQMPYNGIE